MPSSFYLGEPVNESTALNYPLLPVSPESLAALSALLGYVIDPELGLLAVRIFDCARSTAPDVLLSKVGPGERWYFADGLPSATANRTGSDGYGGFVNVPLGVASIDAQAPHRSLRLRPSQPGGAPRVVQRDVRRAAGRPNLPARSAVPVLRRAALSGGPPRSQPGGSSVGAPPRVSVDLPALPV